MNLRIVDIDSNLDYSDYEYDEQYGGLSISIPFFNNTIEARRKNKNNIESKKDFDIKIKNDKPNNEQLYTFLLKNNAESTEYKNYKITFKADSSMGEKRLLFKYDEKYYILSFNKKYKLLDNTIEIVESTNKKEKVKELNTLQVKQFIMELFNNEYNKYINDVQGGGSQGQIETKESETPLTIEGFIEKALEGFRIMDTLTPLETNKESKKYNSINNNNIFNQLFGLN